MKILSLIFGIVCGGFVGSILGLIFARCVGLLSKWAYPDDPSAISAGDIFLFTVPAGAMLGAAFGGVFCATRPRLFLRTVFPLAILFLGLQFTLSALRSYDLPRNYVLKVTGTQGADFLGEVRVDGELHKLNGKLPAELKYQAFEVEFAFALRSAKEGEKIAVEVFIDGNKKWGVKLQSENRFAGKYKSFGYSETFGGTEVRGDSDLLPEHPARIWKEDVPRKYVLKVTGTQDADFIGEVRVDGEFHRLHGKLPAEFEYQALEVEFAFALPSAKEGEKIAVEVFVGGKRKSGAKVQSNNRFAGKYKSFGISEAFGGTDVWGESDLLPEHQPAPRK